MLTSKLVSCESRRGVLRRRFEPGVARPPLHRDDSFDQPGARTQRAPLGGLFAHDHTTRRAGDESRFFVRERHGAIRRHCRRRSEFSDDPMRHRSSVCRAFSRHEPDAHGAHAVTEVRRVAARGLELVHTRTASRNPVMSRRRPPGPSFVGSLQRSMIASGERTRANLLERTGLIAARHARGPSQPSTPRSPSPARAASTRSPTTRASCRGNPQASRSRSPRARSRATRALARSLHTASVVSIP